MPLWWQCCSAKSGFRRGPVYVFSGLGKCLYVAIKLHKGRVIVSGLRIQGNQVIQVCLLLLRTFWV